MLGFRKRKLKPAWRFTANGIVWRVVPTQLGVLIGEARDAQTMQASFFCLHRETGRVMWKGKTFGEQWWIGIEALQCDTLLLYKFATPELPEHQSIIAVDVQTGNELWRNDALKFESVSDETLVAIRRTLIGHEQVTVAMRTGEVVHGATPLSSVQPDGLGESGNFPTPIFDLFTNDSPTNSIIRRHCNADTMIGFVECCSLSRLLIFSYHERSSSSAEEPKFNTQLKVLEQGGGTILYSETINQSSSIVVPENFFVQDGMLFYIVERTMLCALPLSEQPA